MTWINSLLSVGSTFLILTSEVLAQTSEAPESGWSSILGYLVPLLFFWLFFMLILRKQKNATAEYMKRGYQHMDRMEELTAEIVTLLKRDKEGAEHK